MTGAREADRVRRCRELFALAIAHGVSMDEARRLHAQHRWAAADQRLAARRCGTRADEIPARPIPADAPWMMRE